MSVFPMSVSQTSSLTASPALGLFRAGLLRIIDLSPFSLLTSPRWTRAGEKSGFWTCPCARRTVRAGGKTAAALTPARATGTRAGTGPQVKAGVGREGWVYEDLES